ncbi:hypothetical protein AN958_01617 [Leucoagaricus sp. SymC.cos]|nr:hypothetical protein AN958_01617 [Leucoagaricus sp. SymC.cos]
MIHLFRGPNAGNITSRGVHQKNGACSIVIYGCKEGMPRDSQHDELTTLGSKFPGECEMSNLESITFHLALV